MSVTKIVTARRGGWCSQDFAHAGKIIPGDRVLVVTTFPREWPNSDYDRPFFGRYRLCSWCLAREEAEGWRVHPRPQSVDSGSGDA